MSTGSTRPQLINPAPKLANGSGQTKPMSKPGASSVFGMDLDTSRHASDLASKEQPSLPVLQSRQQTTFGISSEKGLAGKKLAEKLNVIAGHGQKGLMPRSSSDQAALNKPRVRLPDVQNQGVQDWCL